MVTSHQRGHPIYWDANKQAWLYADDHTPATVERPCVVCYRMPTPEGYDHCLGYIPGARAACCGHGVEPGYVLWEADGHGRGQGTMRVTITIEHTEAADASRTVVAVEGLDDFGERMDVPYALLVGVLELAKAQVLDHRREAVVEDDGDDADDAA